MSWGMTTIPISPVSLKKRWGLRPGIFAGITVNSPTFPRLCLLAVHLSYRCFAYEQVNASHCGRAGAQVVENGQGTGYQGMGAGDIFGDRPASAGLRYDQMAADPSHEV